MVVSRLPEVPKSLFLKSFFTPIELAFVTITPLQNNNFAPCWFSIHIMSLWLVIAALSRPSVAIVGYISK
jgi:hypothetical protein